MVATSCSVRIAVGVAAALGLATAMAPAPPAAATQAAGRREFSVAGRNFAFEPSRIEASQGDVVKISFRAHDIAHSFTVDAYRIAKRAAAGETVTFEFHADRAGTFPVYCNLTIDERCKEMRGELVVRTP